jgi:phosphoglycolate phosphatase-like HAD superfamily hydrolase
MLGDTPYDVKAARRAGVRIIGVRCGGWNDKELIGAAEIYENPADLLLKYERSLLSRQH